MSRWDYDTVFYRVFCITLLAVAFTFTVILTNVFVDIDGLLSTKDKNKTPKLEPAQNDISDILNVNILPDEGDKSEAIYDDKDYQDSNDLYRSKRSLESTDTSFQIKDPNIKKLLTNRLATLLDELDEEESTSSDKNERQDSVNQSNGSEKDKSKHTLAQNVEIGKHSDKHSKSRIITLKEDDNTTKNENDELIIENFNRIKENKERSSRRKDKKKKSNKDDELLHLAMHNLILQGIIGNMNLDDVYSNMADLVKEFEHDITKFKKEEFRNLFKDTKHFEDPTKTDEEKLFDVLINFKDAQNQIDTESTKRSNHKDSTYESKDKQTTVKPKAHNVMIKTIIDITALTNDKTNKESDKINGVIKLIYNGKSIKFKRMDDDGNVNNRNVSNNSTAKTPENYSFKNIEPIEKNNQETDAPKLQNSYYKKLIHDYLKRIQMDSDSLEHNKVYSRKRLKRHIKIRYDNKKTTEKPSKKKDDDELFVEIETHFDSKGAKGEKKKKLIREIIEKIQKAIHSDTSNKKKKHRNWHVKKRTQNPLGKGAYSFLNKLMLPLETLAQRHLDPISKSVPMHDTMPLVSDSFGHTNWHHTYLGPKFFSKSINSAEMSTVDTDYDKVMRQSGIPQRLQRPLNTDMSEEELQESVVDLGNIKFLMKDIDGSGFSIGFNQYTDEAPDPETMKLFTGIESIIKTYHQNYDQESVPDTQPQNTDDEGGQNNNNNPDDFNEYQENENREQLFGHLINRRSIKECQTPNHHSNEYKYLYNHNFLPYDIYKEIFESGKEHTSNTKNLINTKTKQNKNSVPLELSMLIDEKLLERNLKPAEILSISDLFERRKRSLNVKKISTVNMNKKLNRYLNTKSMASKSVFKKKKRNKRQIDKIRVVARELPNSHRNSEEDMFIVSDEKIYADRALVRDPDFSEDDKIHLLDHYDIITPQKQENPFDLTHPQVNDDTYDLVSPYTYEVNPFEPQNNNEFSRRARHNSLMSKYPHIIMEEMGRSKEEMFPDNSQTYAQSYNVETTTNAIVPTLIDVPAPSLQEISDFISPLKDNSNFKVTVKIRPKNSTSMSGFKEVHTSINKSYNKNGLTYTSLVNVSQLSKVENINKNATRRDLDHPAMVNLKQQHKLIKSLIMQHKNRIDQQLKQLNLERQKLDTLNEDNTAILTDKLIDVPLPTNPKTMLHLTQDEINKLIHLEEASTDAGTPYTQTELTGPTTPATTTIEYSQPTTEYIDKIEVIRTIERNENTTNEILKKIDQNTDVLKSFLDKLIARLDAPSRKINTEETLAPKNGESYVVRIEEKPNPNINNSEMNQFNQAKNSNNNMQFNIDDYHQNIPNIYFKNVPRQANKTLGIPFVYAYQQPYMLPNKESMASVVYHGHIHTNTMKDYIQPEKTNFYSPNNARQEIKTTESKDVLKVNEQEPTSDRNDVNKDFWKPKPGEKVLHDFVMRNSTKFFIDDSESTYKIAPLIKPPSRGMFNPPLGLMVNSTTVR